MTTNKFVYKIINEPVDGYTDVVLDRETFKMLAGFKTAMSYKTGVTKSGEGVRIYELGDVPVYRAYVKGENGANDSYKFKMKLEDAQAALMETEDALPFSF